MDISRLKPTSAQSIFYGLSPAFCMGALMYISNPTFFLTTEIWHLILILVSLSVPIYITNFIIVATHSKKDLKHDDDFEDYNRTLNSTTGIMASLQLSLLCYLSYYYPISNKALVSLEVGILIFLWIAVTIDKKARNKKTTLESKPSPSQTE